MKGDGYTLTIKTCQYWFSLSVSRDATSSERIAFGENARRAPLENFASRSAEEC
jgi:hypothetical protein